MSSSSASSETKSSLEMSSANARHCNLNSCQDLQIDSNGGQSAVSCCATNSVNIIGKISPRRTPPQQQQEEEQQQEELPGHLRVIEKSNKISTIETCEINFLQSPSERKRKKVSIEEIEENKIDQKFAGGSIKQQNNLMSRSANGSVVSEFDNGINNTEISKNIEKEGENSQNDPDSFPLASKSGNNLEKKSIDVNSVNNNNKLSNSQINKFNEMYGNNSYQSNKTANNIRFIPKVTNDNFSDNSIKEVIRLISQFFLDQGLKKSYRTLIDETQVPIENPTACKLRASILNGDWIDCFESLDQLFVEQIIDEHKLQAIKTSIYEQYFFELILAKKYLDAAICLRVMSTTSNIEKIPSIMNLSIYLMCSHSEFVKQNYTNKIDVNHYRKLLLNNIQQNLGLDIMLPQDRLKQIIMQSHQYQISKCRFHQSDSGALKNDLSILTDHKCSKKNIPSLCNQILCDPFGSSKQNAAIVRCKFSPDGRKFVIGGEKGFCSLYDVDTSELRLKFNVDIPGLKSLILNISWSPDSTKFVVIGESNESDAIIYDSQASKIILNFKTLNYQAMHVCDWFPDNQRIIIGGSCGYLRILSLQGELLKTISGYRAIAIKTISNFMFYTADTLNRVILHDLAKEIPQEIMKLSETIVSATFNLPKSLVLLNISKFGLKLYDLSNNGSFLVYFLPSMINRYVHLPTFGGINKQLIASGHDKSNNLLIWNANNPELVFELNGHTQFINQVDWNPKYHGMLASVSEDHTIRVWVPENFINKK